MINLAVIPDMEKSITGNDENRSDPFNHKGFRPIVVFRRCIPKMFARKQTGEVIFINCSKILR